MDNGTGKYNYPPVKYLLLDEWVEFNKIDKGYHHVDPTAVPKEIIIPRGEYMRDKLKPYRAKVKIDKSNITKIDLF